MPVYVIHLKYLNNSTLILIHAQNTLRTSPSDYHFGQRTSRCSLFATLRSFYIGPSESKRTQFAWHITTPFH